MRAEHIRNHHRLIACRLDQSRDLFVFGRQRLLDQKRFGARRERYAMRDMQMRRSANHRGVPIVPRGILDRGVRLAPITAGHVFAAWLMGLAQSNRRADLLKATEMAFADRSAADDEHA